ncbi:MAG: O-antigen ligase family protein [Paracoccaceae bacterium]
MSLKYQKLNPPALNRIELFLARLLIFDIIFLGPIGVRLWGGVTERHLLLFLSLGISLVFLLKRRSCSLSLFYTLFAAALYIVVWGLFIPLIAQGGVSSALSEIKPLMYLFFIPSALRIRNNNNMDVIRRDVLLWSLILGSVIVFVWFKATISAETTYALGIKSFYSYASGTSDGIYIGPMPDSSFRVFWISCAIFPWSILLLKRSDKLWGLSAILFLCAAYATGTRAIFYTSVIAFLFTLYKHVSFRARLVSLGALVLILSLSLDYGFTRFEEARMFEVRSDFNSDSARYTQTMSLIESWQDSIFLGRGLGSSADVVRSKFAPYSYELTYVALLMKTGVLGVIFAVAIFMSVHFSIHSFSRYRSPNINRNGPFSVGLVLFLMVTFTNPYLFTIHGLVLLTGLLIGGKIESSSYQNRSKS